MKTRHLATAEQADRNFFGVARKFPAEVLDVFWKLPFDELVDIARDTAQGGRTGRMFGWSNNVVTSIPMVPVPSDKQSLTDLITQKILVSNRLIAARIVAQFAPLQAEEIVNMAVIKGLIHLERAYHSGNPVCLVSGHLGPGQITTFLLSKLGFPMTHLGGGNVFESFGMQAKNQVEFCSTKEFHLKAVATGVRALKNRRVVLTTGDGAQGASGKVWPFLSKFRHFSDGFAYMICQTNAQALPVFTELDIRGRLTVTLHPPLCDLPPEAKNIDRMNLLTRGYLDLLESYWIKCFGNVRNIFVLRHLELEDAPATARRG